MPMAQMQMPQRRPPPYQSPALGPNFRPPPPAMPPGGGGGFVTHNMQPPPGGFGSGGAPGYFQPPPNARPMPEGGLGGGGGIKNLSYQMSPQEVLAQRAQEARMAGQYGSALPGGGQGQWVPGPNGMTWSAGGGMSPQQNFQNDMMLRMPASATPWGGGMSDA